MNIMLVRNISLKYSLPAVNLRMNKLSFLHVISLVLIPFRCTFLLTCSILTLPIW